MAKKFFKYFLFFFVLSFIVINWSDVYWIFNSRVVFGLTSDFLSKSGNYAIDAAQTVVEDKKAKDIPLEENTGSIEIPKLDVSAPLVFNETLIRKELYQALSEGVVFYPTSVLPSKAGQTILLGHSAPLNQPKVKYNWVFSRLNELEEGDLVYVYLNGKKLTYTVRHTIFLDRGEEIPEHSLTNLDNVIVLISCWPPGKDIRRIAVMADLVNR